MTGPELVQQAIARRLMSKGDPHGLAQLKQEERATWAAGDYGAIAETMFWEVGARIVERVAIRPGDRVLDVACGTGNAALRAARAGGSVVGVDLTPELLQRGRRLASVEGLDVEWVEGDAEALPFADGSFDAVLSTFGCMFAPRHAIAARELVRVLRPQGRFGICSWTPDSSIAALMRSLFRHVPPPPGSGDPPPLWGAEDHVRGLFAGSDVELRLERRVVEFRFDSVEQATALFETAWGPFVEARRRLEPRGRWPALRADIGRVLEEHDHGAGAGLVVAGEYLEVVGIRP